MTDAQELFNPFPGLRPFETDEYNLFFGREGQSDELLARLGRTRFLAVVGTSGSGKSSLVRAGLLPALYGGLMAGTGSGWRVALMRPGHDPVGNLARALGEAFEAGGEGDDDGHMTDAGLRDALIETTLRRSTLGLSDAVRQARLEAHENLLVVVDQFEELFRYKAARDADGGVDDDASAFVRSLLEASARRDVPVYVVITMRSDFLGDCAQFWGLPEAINEGQYLIPRMTRDERREAITGPAAVGGGEVSPPLLNRLLNDMGDSPDQLPILQHALMRTWDFWESHRKDGEPLGVGHYEAVGAMADALSRHADEAFEELADERSRHVAEKIFKRLTEKGADNRETRRPTPLRELCADAEASEAEAVAVVETFRREGRSFLTPPEGVALAPETVIDISHESLIRNWQRLKDWVDEEALSARIYRRLAEAAALHREGREGLLNDPALQIALDWRDETRPNAAWAARYHPEFDTSVNYLDASREHREQEQQERERARNELLERERREREQAERFAAEQQKFASEQARAAARLRRLMFVLALVSLLALGAAGGAAYAYTQARVSRARAERLAGELKSSFEGERAAKNRAESALAEAEAERSRAQAAEQRALAEQKRAETEEARAEAAQKHAEQEEVRAEEQTRIAAGLATKERAARVGLQQALTRAESIKGASRFFRDALADFDRAKTDVEQKSAYAQIKESVGRFEAVQDWDGVAAAYIKIGAASPMFNFEPWGDELLSNWDSAVRFYVKSGNRNEAGETLESLGDALAVRALADAGDRQGLTEDSPEIDKLESTDDRVLTIPEPKRVEIIGRYEAAYREFEQAEIKSPRKLIKVLNKAGVLYDSLGGDANKRQAIEKFERSLSIQKTNIDGSEPFLNGWLIRLYHETERPARAEPFIRERLEAARAKGWKEEAEALYSIAFYLRDHPAAAVYGERARQLYRGHGDTNAEARLLLSLGSDIHKVEASKARHGKPLSPDNYKRALSYYESAMALSPPLSEDPKVLVQLEVLRYVAELNEVTGRKPQAVEAYERVAALAKGVKNEVFMSDIYKKLGPLQVELNHLPQALATYVEYRVLLDSVDESQHEAGEREGVLQKIEEIHKQLDLLPDSITVLLPAEGRGFTTYAREPDGLDQYGRASTIKAVIDIGEAWAARHADLRIQVGDISRRRGGAFPPHAGHQRGVDVDFRPLTNNGREEPTSIGASNYSHELTREFVLLIKQKFPAARVFFNDPRLIEEGLTQRAAGHDDHLLVRFP